MIHLSNIIVLECREQVKAAIATAATVTLENFVPPSLVLIIYFSCCQVTGEGLPAREVLIVVHEITRACSGRACRPTGGGTFANLKMTAVHLGGNSHAAMCCASETRMYSPPRSHNVKASASMFPTEGPLRESKPAPVLVANVDNITSNSGPFRLTYPNGDVCEGRWASIAPQMVATGWGSIFSKYGVRAGVTTVSANVPGVNRGEAMAVCKSGNSVQVEFYTGSGTANGVGVAKDDLGNVFKLIF